MKPRRKQTTIASLTLLAAISLAACGYTPKLASSPPGNKLPPALDEARITRILQDTNRIANAADASRDWQKLVPRFHDPARQMRFGEYVTANVTPGVIVAPLPLTKPQAAAVQQAGDWPRYFLTVSPAVKGQSLQVFAFVQSQARENYKLWGYVKLFPKAKLPATFKPAVGSPAGETEASPLVAHLKTLARDYAAILNDPNAKTKAQFDTTKDAFLQLYNQRRTSYAQLAGISPGLEVGINATPGLDGYVALGTTTGGALVMAEIKYDITMKAQRPLKLNLFSQVMTGKQEGGTTISEKHTALVLFDVPPADAKGEARKIKVLGAQEAITGMEVG